MTRRFFRSVSVGVALVATVAMVSAAARVPPERAPSQHDRVVAYWTAERIASAVPREIVVDRRPIVPQAKPPWAGGNGGGGDDSSTGAVTGAPWEKGGAVKYTTGKVLFTLNGTNYVCSGSVVTDTLGNYSMVVTAGHCVYDDGRDNWATNWAFYPNFEDNPTLNCAQAGCFTAAWLVTTQEWAAGDFEHDYAFAVMNKRNGTLLESSHGTQAIAFNQARGTTVYAFGYPHARPYDGKDLIYCAGTTKDDPFGGTTQGLACDMTGGSSGGPHLANFSESTGTGTLYSVNSYKYRNDKNTMYGPYFGTGTKKTYDAANGSSGNLLVDAVP